MKKLMIAAAIVCAAAFAQAATCSWTYTNLYDANNKALDGAACGGDYSVYIFTAAQGLNLTDIDADTLASNIAKGYEMTYSGTAGKWSSATGVYTDITTMKIGIEAGKNNTHYL